MLVLAFDTATDVLTSALLDDGRVVAERIGAVRELVGDVGELLASSNAAAADLDAVVVGTGPGSFTSTRIGIAFARGLGLGLDLDLQGAGVSTLAALAAAHPEAYPVIDARRGEVFVPGPRAVSPDDLELQPGALCIGSGAVRYRAVLERRGAVVPPDDDVLHIPHARLHASLVRVYGDVDGIEPIYVRAPDAELPRP